MLKQGEQTQLQEGGIMRTQDVCSDGMLCSLSNRAVGSRAVWTRAGPTLGDVYAVIQALYIGLIQSNVGCMWRF